MWQQETRAGLLKFEMFGYGIYYVNVDRYFKTIKDDISCACKQMVLILNDYL